ncbi:MAG: adenylate/guanylate cyclase domain-containing protein [Bacteroidia bacterium]|nr:adenylate/guanylate cyclase domain-containing protein [Bacteroidia bacterium]
MNVRLFSLLTLFTLVFASQLPAQANLDKIKQGLAAAPENEAKINLLIEASRDVNQVHPREALEFASEALALAQKLRSKEGVVNAYSNIGLVYINQDKYTLARESLEKAIDLKTQLVKEKPSWKGSIAKDYRLLGVCFEKLNQLEKALDNLQKGVSLALEVKNMEEIALGYNSIGEVNIAMENYQGALMAFNRALPIARQTNNRITMRTIEKNQATSYALLRNYMEKQEVQLEIESFEEEIETIKDSLQKEQANTQMVISEKQLLEIKTAQKEAELKAAGAEIEARDAALEAKNAAERNYLIGAIGGVVIFLMIILGLISRSRAKSRHARELQAEKEKADTLLLNIIPEKVARELMKNGKVVPVNHDQVTILFTDFKNFTSIASKMTPEELVKELETAFNAFDEIIHKYGLYKIKTIGDAYMAAGNLTTKDPEHALNAVRAGMEMQEFMDRWIGRKKRRGEEVWELRVGIHTGQVVAGVIGQQRFAYDIWGDAVNIASRMESSGEAGKVNISAETYSQVKAHAEFEEKRTELVKNKGVVEMYFVKDILSKTSNNHTPVQPADKTKKRWF